MKFPGAFRPILNNLFAFRRGKWFDFQWTERSYVTNYARKTRLFFVCCFFFFLLLFIVFVLQEGCHGSIVTSRVKL